MNMMHEIEPKMKLTSVILTVAVDTLALAVAGKVGVMFGIFNIFYASLFELMIYAALAIGSICLLKIKDRLIAVANKLQGFLCYLWARALPIAIGFLVIAILGRVGVACDSFIISHVFETACGVFNISFALLFEGMICILSPFIVFLYYKNKVNEGSAQVIIAFIGLMMVSAFIGIMFSDSISGVLQEWFGVEKSTDDSSNPKNAVLEFIGLGIGGIIAAYGLIAFNKRAIAQIKQNELQIKQNDLTKIGLSQERFKAAVEHLSNIESESGRIASFYEFYYLAKDAKGNEDGYTQTSAQTILDILCAHLRLTAGIEEDITADNKNPASPSDDENIKDDKDSKRQKEEINSLIGLLFGKETGTVFSGLKFNFQHVKIDLGDVDFSSINLTEANFNFAHLINADFENTILCQALFKGATLQNANFQGADLQEAKLRGTDLRGANLQTADLRKTILINAKLQWAELQWTKWQNAYLLLVDLRNADLRNADLRNVDLRWANLRGADLQNADLQNANLRDADLRETSSHEKDLHEVAVYGIRYLNAKFKGTDLQWADLRETKNLETAELSGAKYSEETKFPDNFDPKDYGMKLCPPYNEENEEE